MITQQNFRTISDMREKAKQLLKDTQKQGPLYILYRSKPEGVLMSLDEYNNLKEIAEDYYDGLKAQEYENQDKKKVQWVSEEELMKEVV